MPPQDDARAASWTIDFHVAQNDATVKGRARTIRPDVTVCRNDPGGKLDVVAVAGMWLRDHHGKLTESRTYAGTAACSRTKP